LCGGDDDDSISETFSTLYDSLPLAPNDSTTQPHLFFIKPRTIFIGPSALHLQMQMRHYKASDKR
jgi:hypothetical protein